MSYRDDAFFKLFESTSLGGAAEPNVADNNATGQFLYPNKSIRFLEAQQQLKNPTGETNQYKLQRGYIRSLEQPGLGGDLKILKCRFQFNPQQINQNVQMNENVYLPILQDPTQFSQPFAGSVNFSFDLLFDRSREVASNNSAIAMRNPAELGLYEIEDDDKNTVKYQLDTTYTSPNDIGVMTDLQVLYAIIGQGFSRQLIEYQAKRLSDAAVRLQNLETPTADSKTDSKTDTSVPPSSLSGASINSKATDFTGANIGNAAFLIPNPVRVVFSSLFMVDGFVTGTDVDFLKFNTNMVPIQVRVTLTMNAVYIGFARKNTFLTTQLEASGAALQAQKDEDFANVQELYQMLSHINRFNYFAAYRSNSPGLSSEKQAFRIPIQQWCYEDAALGIFQWRRATFLQLGTAQIQNQGSILNRTTIGREYDFTEKDYEVCVSTSTDFVVDFDIKIWGPFNSEDIPTSLSFASTPDKFPTLLTNDTLRGWYTWMTSSLISDIYLSGTISLGSTAKQYTYYEGLDRLTNKAHNSYKVGLGPSYGLNKYYIVLFTTKAEATRQGSPPYSSLPSTFMKVVDGNDNINGGPVFNWISPYETKKI